MDLLCREALLATLLLLVSFAYQVIGLECYACVSQENNRDKCAKTTQQCEEHQDICSTTILWGLPPYWVPYGDRAYFITKGCDTTIRCEQKQSAMLPHCKRDWWDDWGCVECCNGDLCNYYVTMGVGTIKASFLTVTASVLIIFLFRR